MNIGGFFRNLFRSDERVDFYAKVFAALIVSVDRKLDDAADRIKSASETFFSGTKQQALFAELTRRYIADCAKNETALNQLARKIARLGKLYPSWLAGVKEEGIAFAKADNDGLQDRTFEFIASLKAEAAKTEAD
ncbi:MAG: hypothetical protein LBI57_01690 [Helicobacteraceae bacterium]|jgi:hypothetical protein|nr:hypothetical protein [Helicobacteraceae bacterium]